MPLLSRAGSILRKTANRQSSIHQAIRCVSSMGSQEALKGSLYSTDQQSLKKAFAKSGEVDGTTFMDCDTGRSAGHGFITSSAIQPLDGQELHGRQVGMNYATDRPQSNFGGFYGAVGYHGQHGSRYGFGVGYGLRSYRSGAGDKSLSTGNSSNYGPGASVGTAVNSTIGSADKLGVGQRNSFSTGATANTVGGYEISYTRSGASTANEHDNSNTLRPLSPHLPVYKPQVNLTRSILDRIAASYLTTIILVYYLAFMKMGAICFTFEYFYIFLFYSASLVPLSLELSAVAMAYHTNYGMTHFWLTSRVLGILDFESSEISGNSSEDASREGFANVSNKGAAWCWQYNFRGGR